MRYRGVLPIAVAMGIWSSWGLFVRWLALPPWVVSFYVGLVSCACSALLWVAGGGAVGRLWPRADHGRLLALGLLFAANNVLFLSAYERTTVANAVLTHYTAPLFVAVLAPITLGEALMRRTPLALLLAGLGTGLLLPGLDLSGRHLEGLLMGTGSGLAYAGLVLLARHLSPRLPGSLLLFWQNGMTVLLLAPWAVRLGVPAGGRTWLALLVLGTVHATVAGLLYLSGIRSVKAQAAAVLGYLEPLGAVALAALFLGESPGPLGLVGGALILLGGGLVALEPRETAVRA
ncbi:MAG: EamA family transporter [Deltaproteobacteria bacterium]|nr:EamA family transporter [Deltaproteobacteria bacterium]